MLALIAALTGFSIAFGIIYPLAAILLHRLCGSRKSIRKILSEL